MLRQGFTFLLVFTVICGLMSPTALHASKQGNEQVRVLLNGQALAFDQPAVVMNGRTMVPFRTIFESLGAEVVWNPALNQVQAQTQQTSLQLTIGKHTALKNDSEVRLDAPPVLLRGRTLIPLRFISESLGHEVNWDATTNTASIKTMAAQPIFEKDGVSMISKADDAAFYTYTGEGWEQQFWTGVNLGVTIPGHYPGELAPAKSDYLRWFGQMKTLNVDLVRVYTILPPRFYEALYEFNQGRSEPLYLLQGIYTPEEAIIGEDRQGRDVYAREIKQPFQQSIREAVQVIHGSIELAEKPGHASGNYTTDVSPYVLGWLVGTEWFPKAVHITNEKHNNEASYQGMYFSGKPEASAFENWLAEMLDTAAKEDMRFGWQRPVAFTNWVTTDPLEHPNEPYAEEDMVSIDPLHIEKEDSWKAGYYAAYHVYPYYPDSLRYDQKYQDYRDPSGERNPYAGYLNELRAHHQGMPLIVAEFGVPSSRGMAHRGPLGYDQGHHTEQEQADINAKLLRSIVSEKLDGAIVFAWHDEWFKFTWNTIDLTLPRDRRAMWFNRLTNEANFGLLAVEAGETQRIVLDGRVNDWNALTDVTEQSYPAFDVAMTHDEAYVYFKLRKSEGPWDFTNPAHHFLLGFDIVPGGSHSASGIAGSSFAQPIEFLLDFQGEGSYLYIQSSHDPHTWLYGAQHRSIPYDPSYADAKQGKWLNWQLALSGELHLPDTQETIPFDSIDLGELKSGITDPNQTQFNSLADWYVEGDVLELRLPWMMLGYTDPSSHQAWASPYAANGIKAVDSPGIKVLPMMKEGQEAQSWEGLLYRWDGWDVPTYHERPKAGFERLSKAFEAANQSR